MKKTLLTLALFAAVCAMPHGAWAVDVDLELVLAVDVSGSVNDSEFALQRNGYVSAFNNANVISAIESGAIGKIAATLVYWSGIDGNVNSQVTAVGWTLITDAASSQAFAAAISAAPRPSTAVVGSLTGVGDAINYSAGLFGTHNGTRQVIDVSGDGRENTDQAGWPDDTAMAAYVQGARDAALAAGVDAINGLAILTDDLGLDTWYANNVKGGTGSFVVTAADFDDFTNAVDDKIIREVTGVIPEPGTMLLLGSGLVGLAGAQRRRKS